jgi:hypothetical protein
MAPFFTGFTRGLGGGGFGRKSRIRYPQIIIGGRSSDVTTSYQPYSFSSGDSITVENTGYYSFKLYGGKGDGGSGGQGGTTEASVYLQAGSSVYIRTISTAPQTKTAGYGLYLGTTNSLDPAPTRPNSTILVVGSGGAQGSSPDRGGGSGGGLVGGSGVGERAGDAPGPNYVYAPGGTQSSGGSGSPQGGASGTVWYGGSAGNPGPGCGWGPGGQGGHGWYGGGGGGGDQCNGGHVSGGGGSGYITNVLVNINTHGHIKIGVGETTLTGNAGWPSSTPFSITKLEIKQGLI